MDDRLNNILKEVCTAAGEDILSKSGDNFDWWTAGGGTKEELKEFIAYIATCTVAFMSENMPTKFEGQILMLMLANIQKNLGVDPQ